MNAVEAWNNSHEKIIQETTPETQDAFHVLFKEIRQVVENLETRIRKLEEAARIPHGN